MSRLHKRCWTVDLAATLLVVLVAVSVADIDDYDMHVADMRSPVAASAAPNATAELFSAAPDSGSDSDHVCSCLLCVTTLADSFGPRVLPPSAGKLSTPGDGAIAGFPHMSEVFHPPSA